MDQGWLKFHRKMLDNVFLMQDNTAYIVFTKLLMLANSRTGTYTTGRFQLSEHTNIKPGTLYKALLRLEDNRLVTLKSNNRFTDIHICNWSKYQSAGNTFSNNTVTTGEQQSNNTVTLNKNKKEEVRSNSKELATPRTYGNPEINEMFVYWEQVIGYKILANVRANRNACSNLVKKHGVDGVRRLVDGVSLAKQDQFAPRIADFAQLQSKYNELVSWGQVQHRKKSGLEVII